MIKSFGKFWQNFAEFSPRTRRRDFWFAFLCNLIINTVLVALYFYIPIFKYILIAYTIVCLCPSLAICFRRLHDTGKSGALLLLSLIPVIGWIILFVFFVKDSDEQDNRYGSGDKYGNADSADGNNEAVQGFEDEEPPMYIPPIYATDSDDRPSAAFTGKPEAAGKSDTQAAQPKPAADNEDSLQYGDFVFSGSTADTSAADDGTSSPAQGTSAPDVNTGFTAPERPSYSSESQPYNPVSRPDYGSAASDNTGEAKPKNERPKGYRSRSFPYGH